VGAVFGAKISPEGGRPKPEKNRPKNITPSRVFCRGDEIVESEKVMGGGGGECYSEVPHAVGGDRAGGTFH